MKPRLNDYLIPIGRLAIAGAFLEEVVIRWGALLSGAVHHETHAKHLRRGLKSNLDFLVKQVELRVSPARQRPVIDLIETGGGLKDKRNENVHAVWCEMVEAETGTFSHVARSRYDTDADGKLVWVPHITPTVSELEQFAAELDKNARKLNECLADLWDTDEQVQCWRAKQGSRNKRA
jgi:hypothetical protein